MMLTPRSFKFAALLASAGFLASLGATPAQAVVILTLENPGSQSFTQQQNSPCAIGESSCSNPTGFNQADLPNGMPTSYDVSNTDAGQPGAFTVQQIRNVVGNTFFVGIDVNTTTQPLAT